MNCPSCGYFNPTGSTSCSHCALALPTPVSDGATCARHPEVAATGACSRCGTFGCGQCLTMKGTQWLCPSCLERQAMLPWDERETLGLWRAWWRTSTRLIGAPTQTLQGASPEGSMGSSALFALLSVLVGVGPFMLLMLGFGALGAVAAVSSSKASPELGLMGGIFAGEFVFILLLQFASVFLIAAFDHLALMAVGAQPRSYEVTLRANALSMGVYLVGLVPFCGLYVAGIWALVIRIFAYMHLHKISGGKAAAGALLPLALFCGLGLFAWLALIGLSSSLAGR